MVATDKDKKPASKEASPCYVCHRLEMEEARTSLHQPVGKWQCQECHQAELGESDLLPDIPVRYAVAEIAELATLCYRCHTKEEKKFTGYEYLHGPVGEGTCMGCHDPHSSNFQKLLHHNPTKLCVDCHDLADMMEQPVVHKVLLQKGCTACHDPHGSQHRLQLKEEIVPLCLSCHKKIKKKRKNHPLVRHPAYGKPHPLDKERMITCVDCHNPHGSEYDKMLPEEDMMMICTNCHKLGGT